MEIAEAQKLWSPDGTYLNTASFGLPPKPAWDALQAALGDWHHGRTSWEPWVESTDRARASFARLVGVPTENVTTGASVSQLVSMVATALPEARVLCPEGEFASVMFPFLARETGSVDIVPLQELADSVTDETDLVGVSAVQSSSGIVTDLAELADACAAHDALLLVDATQAVTWLPLDAGRADFLVAAGYKWLMSPRGTAFMAVREPDALTPIAANWWSAEDPFGAYYGPPLQLADSARRLDISPAWFSWVGTAPVLDLVEEIGVDAIHDHDVALANRFRAGVGLEPSDSAIVKADVPGAEEKLARAGILAAVRAGSVRVSFHVYNTEADVDATLEALAS